jgi:hypothetical protein
VNQNDEAILRRVHRLELAANDMRDVVYAAEWYAARTTPMPFDRVVEAGIVVVYARPFTEQGVGRLDPATYAPTDPGLRRLHFRLIDLRMQLHAHTDVSSFRFIAEDVSQSFGELLQLAGVDEGASVEVVVETITRAEYEDVARLARDQSARFLAAADEARAKLPEPSKGVAKRITFRGNPGTVKIEDGVTTDDVDADV